MSWQAMEAVLEHSGFQKRQDYSSFRVLLAIASFADENGVAGVAGQHLACPTHRAIAAKARVHRNTVGRLMESVLDSGELEIVEQGGMGRSLWSVYRICLPGLGEGREQALQSLADVEVEAERMAQFREEMAPNREEMAPSSGEGLSSGEGGDKELVATVRELAEGMALFREELALFSKEMALLREEMAPFIGTNGTTVQRGVVPDPIRDPGDPERDPGDPRARAGEYRVLHDDSPPFPAPGPAAGEGEKHGRQDAARQTGGGAPRRDLVRPAPDGVGRRRAAVRGTAGAIAEVCGLDLRVRSHRKRCEEAAVQLSGYPEAYILARYGPPGGSDGGWNWYLHDWRGRRGEQPEPRLVVETIGKGYVGPGDGSGVQGRQDAARQTGGGAPAVMSNNETTARKYAELRRKLMED